MGRDATNEVLGAAAAATEAGTGDFRQALLSDPRLDGRVSQSELDAALDPESYVRSADEMISLALAAYEASLPWPD